MKTLLTKFSFLFGLILLFSTSAFGAGEWKLNSDASSSASSFGETTDAIDEVFNLVFWLMYGIGSVMMGISGFKLKQGDVPGFAKMFLGGGVLFISPLVIQNLQTLGQN